MLTGKQDLPLRYLGIDIREYRPLAGRCIVEMDRKPEMIGSIVVPELARDMTHHDPLYSGRVIAMTPRHQGVNANEVGGDYEWYGEEEFAVGDKVWIGLRACDVNEPVIYTHNSRVAAVER
jgi:hypothetical protein